MTIFSKWWIPCSLALIFIAAAWLGGGRSRLDVATIQYLADARSELPRFSRGVIAFTQLGSAYSTLGLALASACYLAVSGKRRAAILLSVAIGLERIAADGLKLVFDRARPAFDLHAVSVNSSSFPSGHAANSMASFAIIAMIAAPPRLRSLAMTAAIVLSVLIGATRPYLGVHWPSDVIGGWALGLLAVWIAQAVGRRSGVLTHEPKHEIIGGHRASFDEL